MTTGNPVVPQGVLEEGMKGFRKPLWAAVPRGERCRALDMSDRGSKPFVQTNGLISRCVSP